MNVWAILVAAALNIAVAMVWYHPRLFGRAWMADVGISEEQARERSMARPMSVGVVSALVQAVTLDYLIGLSAGPTIATGIGLGLLTGLGVAAAVGAPHYAFSGRPRRQFLIDFGQATVALVAMGIVLAAWR